jgi:integral membrane protein
MFKFLDKFENNTLFTESEAWLLFKIAAFAEALGWTLLITGVLLSKYVFSGSQIPVKLAGSFHGMLFLSYAVASVGLYPSLRWSRKKALIALIASVPPYGSLIFEQWANYTRKYKKAYTFKSLVTFTFLTQYT